MFDTESGAARTPEQAAPRKWRPLGTQALIALNLGVFLLQALWGAMSSPPLLAAMGGMVSSRISDGEWWRLFSCTVLHGSPMHIALNCYVLHVLGSFTERVIGTGRFLVLYVVSGVLASAGSFIWTDAVSVGASGAVFGLLGAQGVLAYFPRGLLPDAILPNARRAAMTNLLLNIGVSFMPNVDAAAHFTGAAVGAALVFAGFVTPKVTTPPREQWRLLELWRRGGVITALGYAAVALFGVLQGRPWLHSADIVFENRKLPGVDQTHQFPTFLPPALLVQAEGDDGFSFGADPYEPYWMQLRFRRLGSSATDSEAFHSQLRAQLKARPESSREPATTSIRGRRITCGTQTLGNGLTVDTCVLLDAPNVVTLEGVYWPTDVKDRYQELTLDIASRWWTRADL